MAKIIQLSDADGNVYPKAPVVTVSLSSFSSLPQTISNSKITADMKVINAILGTPSVQLSDWTVTTSAGSAVVSGTISGSTTLTLELAPCI